MLRSQIAMLVALLLPMAASALALDPPEQVLNGAARLSWGDLDGEERVKIWRRVPGGIWERIGVVEGDDEPVFLDRGPGGDGVPPGDWEYGIRALYPDGVGGLTWGPLLPQPFTRHAECAGQPETPPSLPRVFLTDLDSDGRHTGDDIALALNACQSAGGCILEALPVTYEDVEIHFGTYQAETCPPFSQCGNWSLPNGLVIQGHGSATVFEGRVMPAGSYEPRPVFRVALKDQDHDLDGIRFRNFTVDGRKRDQGDPGSASQFWFHEAIDVLSPGAPVAGGCIHNVTAREFTRNGFAIAGANDWIIEHNTIHNIGCHETRTPCDTFTDITPPSKPFRPKMKALGFGINVLQFTDGTIVRHNTIALATKMGIQFKTSTSNWPHPPLPEQQAIMTRNFHAHDNYVVGTLGASIAVNGGISGIVENNVVEWTIEPSNTEIQTANGFVCGNWTRDLVVRDNVFRHNGQDAMAMGCTGEGLVISGNLLEDSCRDVGDGQAVIKIHTSLPGTSATLADNVVGANDCDHAVLMGAGWDPIVLSGGSYTSGFSAVTGMQVTSGSGIVISGPSFTRAGFTQIPGIQFKQDVTSAIVLDGANAPIFSGSFSPEIQDQSGNAVICANVAIPATRIALGCDPP